MFFMIHRGYLPFCFGVLACSKVPTGVLHVSQLSMIFGEHCSSGR